MEFKCAKKDLLRVVDACDAITGGKMNYSLLSNVLIETNDNKLFIKAYNMEMAMETTVEAAVAKKGSVTVSQDKLANLLKQMPDDDILVSVSENHTFAIKPINVKQGYKAEMVGTNSDEFPPLPVMPEGVPTISIDKMYFKKMIQKTIFAIAHSNTQYTLNGVLLEHSKDMLRLVAIDGRRMASIQAGISNNQHANFEAILPPLLLQHLSKIMEGEGPIEFAFADETIFFKFDNFLTASNVLSGKFPDYNMFVPKEYSHNFNVKLIDLKKAINFSTVLIDEDSHKMIWKINKKQLNILSQNSSYGQAEASVELEGITFPSDELMTGLNHLLTKEILQHLETETIEFHLNDTLSPILIKENNRDEYFFIIMPMKIDTPA